MTEIPRTILCGLLPLLPSLSPLVCHLVAVSTFSLSLPNLLTTMSNIGTNPSWSASRASSISNTGSTGEDGRQWLHHLFDSVLGSSSRLPDETIHPPPGQSSRPDPIAAARALASQGQQRAQPPHVTRAPQATNPPAQNPPAQIPVTAAPTNPP